MTIKTQVPQQESDQEERTIQLRAADPGSPVADQLWINTTDRKLKYYDGASTKIVIDTGGSVSYTDTVHIGGIGSNGSSPYTRRFDTILINQGTAITASIAGNMSFTINSTGIYSITLSDLATNEVAPDSPFEFAIIKNSTSSSLPKDRPFSEILAATTAANASGGGQSGHASCGWTGTLQASDVIYAYISNSSINLDTKESRSFSIVRIA